MGQCLHKPLVDERYLAPAVLKGLENIDLKKLRKLISKGHLAPCYIGQEEGSDELEECPICFLHYPALNASDCCTQRICTECILKLQVSTADPWPCPFCKTPDYTVKFTGPKSKQAKERDKLEQAKVQEARARERQDEIARDQERELQRIQTQAARGSRSSDVTPSADVAPAVPQPAVPQPISTPPAPAPSRPAPRVEHPLEGHAPTRPLRTITDRHSGTSSSRLSTARSPLSHQRQTPSHAPVLHEQEPVLPGIESQQWQQLQDHMPVELIAGATSLEQLEEYLLEQALQLSMLEAARASTANTALANTAAQRRL